MNQFSSATKFSNVQIRIEPDLLEGIQRFARIHDLDVSKLTRMMYRQILQVQYEQIPGNVSILDKLRWANDGLTRWFKPRHDSQIARMPH